MFEGRSSFIVVWFWIVRLRFKAGNVGIKSKRSIEAFREDIL